MHTVAHKSKLVASVRDVSVTYGADATLVHAVRGVSLDIYRGEVLLLMGPSGSGKTTLLQVLGCIRHATSGSVLIDGHSIDGLNEDELSRLRCDRIGFVFQHYNLLPSLRAWENVALALELRGESGRHVEQASRRILFELGLKSRADAYPAEMSGGEKQRVAIARAIVGEHDIIFADEPTAALDTESGGEVARLLASIAHEQGRAVVIVTHDPRITGIGDRVVFIEDGAIRSVRKDFKVPHKSSTEGHNHEMEDHTGIGAGAVFRRRAALRG
jgi:putative ABC transport system ATP-binding protein